MILALNALDLMLSFQSLTGFNVIFANKPDFNTRLQKLFISDHKTVNFCKFFVKGYNLCPLCEKIIT